MKRSKIINWQNTARLSVSAVFIFYLSYTLGYISELGFNKIIFVANLIGCISCIGYCLFAQPKTEIQKLHKPFIFMFAVGLAGQMYRCWIFIVTGMSPQDNEVALWIFKDFAGGQMATFVGIYMIVKNFQKVKEKCLRK